jgi:ADP-ribose pyrophosphatase YjhB (NUDIX family)
VSPQTSSYIWVVSGALSSNAYLKVVAGDGSGNAGEDLSDAAFSITARSTGVDGGLPREFALAAVYPNPSFGPAKVAYDVPRLAHVRLSVVDVQGRELAVLEDQMRAAGRYVAAWDGRTHGYRAPAGVYFLRFEAAGKRFVRRLSLTR